MKKIVVAFLLTIAALAQVTWGSVLVLRSVELPLALVALLVTRELLSSDLLLVYAFLTGLLLDVLEFYTLGSNALGFVLGAATYILIYEKLIDRPWVARLVGALAGILVYEGWLWILVKTLPTI